ncbi:MAG: DNA polymerase III subunit [Nitrospinae bacterium]|nr:DNA polymerase III subunit [Nitrospinota bacterium]
MELTFSGIWGQEHALGVLGQSLRRGAVASAYLFAGPRGTGKTTAALAFAKGLLCSGAETVPCGVCRSCKMVDAKSHPDFVHVYVKDSLVHMLPDFSEELEESKGKDPVKILRMAEMRKIISALSLKSYMGGRKVCIMEDTDTILRTTANAFLKTLEEPPGNTVIILISSNPAGLLPTIVSRCRQIRFVPMPPEKLAPLLEETLGTLPNEALRLARLAEGCPGTARGGGMEKMKEIDAAARELTAMLPELAPEAIIRFAESWKERRADIPALLERILETLRMAQRSALGVSSGANDDIVKTYNGIPDERVMDGFDAILAARPQLVFNPNVQLYLEALLFNVQSIIKYGYPLGNTTD